MSRAVLVNLDFNKNEIQNARVQNLPTASAPSSPVTGQIFYDSTLNRLYYWNNAAWVAADGSSVTYGNVTAQTSFGASSANGSATSASHSDHVHGTPAHGTADHAIGTIVPSASPTIALGTAAAAGSANSVIRSDATIAAFDATVPTTSTPGDAAATGSVAFAARRDHVHAREQIYFKQPVRAASTANLSQTGTQTVDNVSLIAGDRILCKDQATASANGIWVVAAGAWSRAIDATSAAQFWPGMMIPVAEGTVNGDTVWSMTTDTNPITVGSTNLAFGVVGSLPGAITAQTTFGAASGNGTANQFARGDHTHGTPAHTSTQHTPGTELPNWGNVTAQTSFGGSSANGVATTMSRSDHLHGTPTHLTADHAAVSISGLAVPTADVSWGASPLYKITNLKDPTAANDAATKGYVDSVATGLDFKGSVRYASTASVSVTYNATGGTSGRGQITAAPLTATSVDSGTAGNLAAGDRILLKNQSTAAQNGIWVVTTPGSGANGVWDRATDFDQDAEVTDGAFMFVEQGATNASTSWVLTTDNPITIGGASGTSLTFAQFGASTTYTWGTGISSSGNTINVGAGASPGSGGPGGGLVANADDLVIDTAIVSRKSIFQVGNASATQFTLNHAFNNQWCHVQAYRNSSPFDLVDCEVELTDANNALVRFATAPSSNQFRVVVVG
jgi:hypothetical protein